MAARAENNDGTYDYSESMKLSPEEKARAIGIRAAIREDGRLKDSKISDFLCVQYALTAKPEECLERICDKAFLLQSFRKEYKICGSVEEGIELVNQYSLQHPGNWLATEYIPFQKNYLVVQDLATFLPSEQVKTDEHKRIFLGAVYYQWNSQFPDFQAIREGFSQLIECEGTNCSFLDPELTEIAFEHFFKGYPLKPREVVFLNAPGIVNVWCGLWKRFLPTHEHNKYHLGLQLEGMEGRRIDVLYKCPNEEEARQRMVRNTGRFLRLRHRNEERFHLASS
ncbi:expressed unknown protein [Seminavis robusta]|uniref:Uncharacterized protein n=1 Tax=Seminavis robusta TaxID=568900 RepID=A0A9N8DUC3_9STRA|nr:expressed unknown protein [Seminavis robusta]|eukprot:Sro377_g130070.1 n/a (282) ;mRNA; f:30086-30931